MAAALALPASAPSIETTLLSPAEVRSWAKGAQPRDMLVYCTGPFVPAGATKEQVNALVKEGAVHEHKRRRGGVLEHCLRRAAKKPAKAPPTGQPRRGDTAQTAILVAIVNAARLGQRCPSDSELARIAKLDTRDQAQWRVRKLQDSGQVKMSRVQGPDGWWRIAEVRGGGRTAAPPAKKGGGRG